jgi:cytochrome c-type biogenesis protein CcmH/NrfG
MNAPEETSRWSNLQTYSLAVICLILGTALGYLAHPAKSAPVNAPQAPIAAANGSMPTPEQLQHMVDAKLAPMLAALQKDPNNPDLLASIGTEYLGAKQFANAEDFYGRAIKVKPTSDGYLQLAGAYYFAGESDQCFAALNKALELNPKSANALLNLGTLKIKARNDPKGAIETWQLLLKDYPDMPQRANVEKMIAQARQQMNSSAGAKTDKPAM